MAVLSVATVPFLLIHQKKCGKFFISGLVSLFVIADQIIKFVMLSLDDLKIEIIPHIFSLELSKNVFHSAMLSFFRFEVSIPGVLLIKVVSLLATLAGIKFVKRKFKTSEYIVWIFILILSGGIASFCDDILWGYTLDYLCFPAYTVMDLKDIYLFVGANLFNVTLLREYLYQKG